MAHIVHNEDGSIILRDDWCVDDVLSIRADLTRDQAEDVLVAAADHHDCNIGIDGVVEQQAHYAHFGFSMAHRNLRYMGDCSTWPTDQSGLDIVNARTLPLAQLVAFDSQYFPAPRPAFLQAWLSPDIHQSLALMQDGQIIAYGTARACIRGYKIGPLFAQDSNSARAILLQLAAWIRQQTQTSSAPGGQRGDVGYQ